MSNVYEELKRLRRDVERMKRLSIDRPQGTAALARYLALPELRGLWPFSSINESGNALDFSGQGRTLTNNAGVTRGVAGLVPYANFSGANYFSRADEAGLDITGSLTWMGWVNVTALTAYQLLAGKVGAVGQLSWWLGSRGDLANDPLRFHVSADGTASTFLDFNNGLTAGVWAFVAVRFIPSTSMTIFVNDATAQLTTAVPAAIFNSTAPFTVGADGSGGTRMAGGIALTALCAGALSDAVITSLYNATAPLFE